jgi:hypothetical protein
VPPSWNILINTLAIVTINALFTIWFVGMYAVGEWHLGQPAEGQTAVWRYHMLLAAVLCIVILISILPGKHLWLRLSLCVVYPLFALFETAIPTLAAESALAKDWLTPEEDSAWANS